MISTKQQIIQAFSDLDAAALELLLQNKNTYSDVSKDLFIERLKEYFSFLTTQSGSALDFKAFPGKCNKCFPNHQGFSFINSRGFCYGHFIFVEADDTYSDIHNCGDFLQVHPIESESFAPLTFYDDEKVGNSLSFEELAEKEFCLRGIEEIEKEINSKETLSTNFMSRWLATYEGNYEKLNVKAVFEETKDFSYVSKLRKYAYNVEVALEFVSYSQRAKKFLEMWELPVFEEPDAKMLFLLNLLEELPAINEIYNFDQTSHKINFNKIYINVDLISDFFSLQEIFFSQMDILPYSLIHNYPSEWSKNEE